MGFSIPAARYTRWVEEEGVLVAAIDAEIDGEIDQPLLARAGGQLPTGLGSQGLSPSLVLSVRGARGKAPCWQHPKFVSAPTTLLVAAQRDSSPPPDHDPMILAAYICEHGAIVSQATNHATSPDGHGGTTLDSLLHFRAQELSHAVGSSAVKRVVVRRHDELLLFCLAQGAQAFVCACTDAPERAFAAFCFLADVCARWSNQTERLGFESVLRAQMVHYSSANLIGAELLRSPDEPARGGGGGGGAVVVAEAEALQARNELAAARTMLSEQQMQLSEARYTAEREASELAVKVVELDAAKQQMQGHSAELVAELRDARAEVAQRAQQQQARTQAQARLTESAAHEQVAVAEIRWRDTVSGLRS